MVAHSAVWQSFVLEESPAVALVVLDDGQKLPVHKSVLCARSPLLSDVI